jgi:prophage regulatory protein
MSAIRILRKNEVTQITGLSNTTIYERKKAGLFPTSISLGGRAVGYLNHEVAALLAALAANYTDDEIKQLVKLMLEQRKQTASVFMTALTSNDGGAQL